MTTTPRTRVIASWYCNEDPAERAAEHDDGDEHDRESGDEEGDPERSAGPAARSPCDVSRRRHFPHFPHFRSPSAG